MNFLVQLLQGMAVAFASQAALNIYGWVAVWVRKVGGERAGPEVQKLLHELGTVPASKVDALVAEFARKAKLPREREAELAAVLKNLTRGAQLLSTVGVSRSSSLRSDRLIDQLLRDVRPVRKAGQAVGQGQDWILDKFLGMGSFGEVWLATNRNSKAIPPRAYKIFTHEGAREWLDREQHGLSAIMQQLGDDPHVVRLTDIGVHGHHHPFLALEYVAGGSLEDWILEDAARRPKLNKHRVVESVVSALAKAHERGIFHRDLKPANILLTEPPDVRPKIADFGLARVEVAMRSTLGSGTIPMPEGLAGASMSSLNASQQCAWQVGTPMYWPPEAWQPFAARDAARDDVFAVGVIWYQLLVERLERPPYDFADALRAAGQDRATIGVISRCLAGPAQRYANAAELDEAIDKIDAGDVEWSPPDGCFDISFLAREYLSSVPR